MQRHQFFWVSIAFLVLIVGCGTSPPASDHSIALSAFDRSCAGDADCVPAYEGPIGCCRACPNSAINQSAYTDYEAAVARSTPICTPALPCVAINNDICKAGAVCRSGTCEFASLAADAASD